MAAMLEARMRAEKDVFSRTAIHISVARRSAFNKIAKLILKKNYDSARESIIDECRSEIYGFVPPSAPPKRSHCMARLGG